jgi:hypothetical protein
MFQRLVFSAALSLALLSACTSVHVKPVDNARFKLVHVCIQENPKVIISDFVQVLREGFERHRLTTELVRDGSSIPQACEYLLTYTARQSWDFSPYLSTARLELRRGNELVSSADYHLRGKGGFSLTKWAGTASKMNPVIDQMLKDF